jgi:hypothetical protein
MKITRKKNFYLQRKVRGKAGGILETDIGNTGGEAGICGGKRDIVNQLAKTCKII